MRRVLVLSVTFLSLYALLLGTFRLLHVAEFTDAATVAVARAVITTLTDRDVVTGTTDGVIWFQVRHYEEVELTAREKKIAMDKLRRRGRNPTTVERKNMHVNEIMVNQENVNTNIPMFFAVVIALAGRRDWRMFLVLAAGTAVLTCLDGVSLAAMIWDDPNSPLPEGLTLHALRLISVWTEGGWLMAPIFIGALISTTWLSPPEAEEGSPS